jgi:hypothetical protein
MLLRKEWEFLRNTTARWCGHVERSKGERMLKNAFPLSPRRGRGDVRASMQVQNM